MKKFFAVLALVGVLASCKDKKKDETKTEETTTSTPTTTEPTTTEPTTTAATGVPTFSDPEVQKFANDYAAFIAEYKAGMKDPARLAELGKNMQDWATKSQTIGLKLAQTPDEAKKWSDWVLALNKEIMPGN